MLPLYATSFMVAFSLIGLASTATSQSSAEKAQVVEAAKGKPGDALKKIDVLALKKFGYVKITVNDPALKPFPREYFDGDHKSWKRSEFVNPLKLTFTFTEPIKLRAISILPYFNQQFNWTVKPTASSNGYKIEKAMREKWSRMELKETVNTKEMILEVEVEKIPKVCVHLYEIELYADLPEVMTAASSGEKKPWPAIYPIPKGMENRPGPWSDPADLTVWPNKTSRANSDDWISENHDKIRRMNPRVLVINVANQTSAGQPTFRHLDKQARDMIRALAEGSRYHGYKDDKALPFLNYQIFKFVDLSDKKVKGGNSDASPLKRNNRKSGEYQGYNGFFTEEFGKLIGIPDPRDSKRFLRLDELVDGGYIHDVWLFAEHGDGAGFEVIELKQAYDENFRKIPGKSVQAGNGGDNQQEWTGRSLRIGHFNYDRGTGCFLESLSHGMEGNHHSNAIPYFKKYFNEYAGFDFKKRFDMPFYSFYNVDFRGKSINYPDRNTVVIHHAGKDYTINNYIAPCGNAHFMPNGRNHYDLDNTQEVMTTIENWRMRNGPDGKDLVKPWNNKAFRSYRDLCGDCMGPWLVYWRQNMPGLDNKAKDDEGKPMKNWWPFLFY